ncbi:MAG: hypothetical protein H7Y00_13375 [Fimbriimonadaceae bacterium]|nr:hypothetical protein [Chitinophagales bacterium]
MVVVLNKKLSKKEIDAVIKKTVSKKKKGFDPDKYVGKVKWNEDAVSYQKEVRNEWD